MSSFTSLFPFSFLFLHLNTCSNNLSFKIQPTVQEHEELILLTRKLKLELIKYSQQLYRGGDDDDDGSDGAGSSESTPSHQQRKRRFQ